MASLFGDPKNLPIECIHNHHQHPYSIRVVNQWVVESGLPIDLKESSTEKSFRKYFGKRVRKLIYIQNPPSFNPGYRCKFLKTARLYSLQIGKYPLRQIENLHVTDPKTWMYHRYQNNIPRKGRPGFGKISTYKRLKYMEADSGRLDMYLKPLRTLTNLQVMSVTMHEDMFAKHYRTLLSLKALKKLNLSIISIKTGNPLTNQSEFPIFSDFLNHATKLKKLEFLGLKLINLFDRIGSDSKWKFFEALNVTDIPAFSIELTEIDVCSIDPQILHFCSKKIDLLELDFEKNFSVAIACGTENITGNAKRKLKMYFKFKSENFNINSAQVQGQNIMHCAIQAETNPFDSEISPKWQISKPIDLASKLKTFAEDYLGVPFSLSKESNMKYLKSFSFNFAPIIETVSGEIDKVLHIILENECNLEHLQLQRVTESCSSNLNVYHCFLMISQTPTVQNLTSLHLTDFSVQENFFDILSEVFRHLKNLKILHLHLQIKDPIEENIQAKSRLIVPENSKLTDVYIKLPLLKGNMISDFIEVILNLHELEELTLPSGNQLIEADKNRLILLDGFKPLKKLRKVSILRGININTNGFPFGVRNDHRNPIVTKVRNELKELYDSNCSLWKCCIESNEPPYQIRYKRY